MPESQFQNTTLPFSLFVREGNQSPLYKASITFKNAGSHSIQYQDFLFQNGSLQREPMIDMVIPGSLKGTSFKPDIPSFTIAAIVLLIIFRNLFFVTFKRYFLSLANNYEIDFNFQKIGLFPLLFSFFITLFAFSEKLENFLVSRSISNVWIENIKNSGSILIYPLIVSIILMVFLNFSARLFPILFSDIKSLFLLALLVIVWNLLCFGSSFFQSIPNFYFWGGLAGLFLTIRSFLFFHVLRRAYQFRMPITLFYICILNLGTFLLLFRGLGSEFIKLL